MSQRSICLLCRHAELRLWAFRPRDLLAARASFSSSAHNEKKRTNSGKHSGFKIRKGGHPAAKGPAGSTKPWHRKRVGARVPFRQVLEEALDTFKIELKEAPLVTELEKEDLSFDTTWEAYVKLMQEDPDTMASLTAVYHDSGIRELQRKLQYGFYSYVTSLRFTESDISNQRKMADARYPSEWFPQTRQIKRSIHLHVGPTNSGKTYHALKSLEAAASGQYAGPLRLLAHEVYTRLSAKGVSAALVTGDDQRWPEDGPGPKVIACTVEMVDCNFHREVAVIDEIQMMSDPHRGWAWTHALLGVQADEVHLCGELRAVQLVKDVCALNGEEVIVHEYERLSPLKMEPKSLGGSLKKLRKGDCIVSFSVQDIHPMRKAIEAATGKKVATVYGSLPPETRAQQAKLFNDPDNDYDYLVASDAIGMGLNLNIKRVIFETTTKFNGTDYITLDVSSIKQIAGRAGRYKSAYNAINADKSLADEDLSAAKGESAEDVKLRYLDKDETYRKRVEHLSSQILPLPRQSVFERAILKDNPDADPSAPSRPPPNDPDNYGAVTTLEALDHPVVAAAIKVDPPPLTVACIEIPAFIVSRFAQYFPPGTPFSFVLMRMRELAQVNSRFIMSEKRDAYWIADLIEPIRNMSIEDRMVFCVAPASLRDITLWSALLPEMARCVEQGSGGALYELEGLPLEILDGDMVKELSGNAQTADVNNAAVGGAESSTGGALRTNDGLRKSLQALERLHKALVAYLWLSYRFAGIFTTRALALHVKAEVEQHIGRALEALSLEEQERWKKRRQEREKNLLRRFEEAPDAIGTSMAESQQEQPQLVQGTSGDDDVSRAAEEVMPAVTDDEVAMVETDHAEDEAIEQQEAEEPTTRSEGAAVADEVAADDANAATADELAGPHDGLPGTTMQIPKHLHSALETSSSARDAEPDVASRP